MHIFNYKRIVDFMERFLKDIFMNGIREKCSSSIKINFRLFDFSHFISITSVIAHKNIFPFHGVSVWVYFREVSIVTSTFKS